MKESKGYIKKMNSLKSLVAKILETRKYDKNAPAAEDDSDENE